MYTDDILICVKLLINYWLIIIIIIDFNNKSKK